MEKQGGSAQPVLPDSKPEFATWLLPSGWSGTNAVSPPASVLVGVGGDSTVGITDDIDAEPPPLPHPVTGIMDNNEVNKQ